LLFLPICIRQASLIKNEKSRSIPLPTIHLGGLADNWKNQIELVSRF